MSGLVTVLAGASAAPRSGEGLKSGPWGLAIILLLCIAVYFLWRSMNTHLKRVRDRSDESGRWRFDSSASTPGDSVPGDSTPGAATASEPGAAGSTPSESGSSESGGRVPAHDEHAAAPGASDRPAE